MLGDVPGRSRDTGQLRQQSGSLVSRVEREVGWLVTLGKCGASEVVVFRCVRYGNPIKSPVYCVFL